MIGNMHGTIVAASEAAATMWAGRAGIGAAPEAPVPAVVRWPVQLPHDSRAGMAAFGATSLKWTPVGSAASASRP
jgi:hypothetical protein